MINSTEKIARLIHDDIQCWPSGSNVFVTIAHLIEVVAALLLLFRLKKNRKLTKVQKMTIIVKTVKNKFGKGPHCDLMANSIAKHLDL